MTENTSSPSGIKGYVYTKTSISIKYANNTVYRYDLSEVLSSDQLNKMIKLAKAGKGLNTYLNANPNIKKYGYLDTVLNRANSFTAY